MGVLWLFHIGVVGGLRELQESFRRAHSQSISEGFYVSPRGFKRAPLRFKDVLAEGLSGFKMGLGRFTSF